LQNSIAPLQFDVLVLVGVILEFDRHACILPELFTRS
jgi:hypothetical protein